jgi:hypothetical protein
VRFRTVGDGSSPEQATLHGCHGAHRAATFVHLAALLRPARPALIAPRDGWRAQQMPPRPLEDRRPAPLDPPS